jgi:hypothetical protein
MRLLEFKKSEHRSISPEVGTRGGNDKMVENNVLLYEVFFNTKVTPYPCLPKNIYL